MKLIADSGSTKTDWCLTVEGREVARYSTQGINPFQQDEKTIAGILTHELFPQMGTDYNVSEVFFYGAGCRDEVRPTMIKILKGALGDDCAIDVNGDLLAAARALCGREGGVACILGTGANSCVYDGKRILSNVPPLGYILGDEGSGAVLGRNFINALYKGRLPIEAQRLFEKEMSLDMADIIRRVYREPLANRFLASFSLFVGRHKDDFDELKNLVIDNFRAFFCNNINRYVSEFNVDKNVLTVNAIGSMAYYFREEFSAAAAIEGFRLGRVEQSPMRGLMEYHG